MAATKLSKLEDAVRIATAVALALLVLGFTWTVSAEHSARRVHASQHAHQYASGTPDRIERACRGVKPPAWYECVAKEVTASHEDQRAEYDLNAQNQMADWAFWMMFVSAAAMALTAWALWYIKETLAETRLMTQQAADGATAARSAAQAAHDANRPWVDMILLPKFPNINDVRVSLEFTVQLENIGNSPALNVVLELTSDTEQSQGDGIAPPRDFTKPIRHELGALIPHKEYYVRDFMNFPWVSETKINPKLGWQPSITANVIYDLPAGGKGRTKRSFLIQRNTKTRGDSGLIRMEDSGKTIVLSAKALHGDEAE